MEVRPGYKQTEVGAIPEEWELRGLLSAVQIANGQVDPRKEPFRSMILVAPDHIESGTGALLDKQTAGDQRAISGKYAFQRGDIVYSKIRPYLKKAILADFDGLCSADMYPLTPVGDVIGGFMLPILLAHRFTKYAESVSVRSGMPKINRAELADFVVALPPKSEQRAIAEVLSDVDALLGGLDRLIAKKRDLKQAAMQQLLTGQTRLPGFSGEWEVKRLGEIAFCFSGGTPPTEVDAYYGGDIPWITSGDLNKGYITDVEGRITAVGLANSSAKMVEADTLLIALYGATSGVTAISKIRAAINQAVLAIIPREDSPTYLYFKLTFLKDWLISTYTQGGQPNLSGDIVKSVRFPLPSVSEQTAIATTLSDMDAELAALEQRRDKTRTLKQAMMQELLTGRTRLVTPATETAPNTAENHSRNAPRQMKENR